MKTLLSVFLIFAIASCSPAKQNLSGYWYKPKSMVNIRFHSDNTFEYNDHDSVSNKSAKLTGTYRLDGTVLTLNFNDKTTQTLSFDKAKPGNKNYFLKQNEDYFMKEEKVNNAVPPQTRAQ